MKYEFKEEKLSIEEIKELSRQHVSGKWTDVINEFIESDKPMCVIDCANLTEAKTGKQSLRAFVRKYDVGVCVYAKLTKIYLIKC